MILSPNADMLKHGHMMISVMIMTHDSLRNDKASHALAPNYSSIAEKKLMTIVKDQKMTMMTMYNRSDNGNDDANDDND